VSAVLLTWIVGPGIMRRLRRMRLHQVIREGTPDAHQQKGRTPTMGGLIILGATLSSTLLWARLDNRYVLIAMICMAWMGAIGFLDDYLKLKQKLAGRKNTGLVEKYKLIGQVTLGFAVGYYLWKYPLSSLPGASTTLPFYKYILIVPLTAGMGWVYVLFVTFVMTGTSNAVNVTDGLDGLAAGLTAIAALTFAFYVYLVGNIRMSQYLHIYFLKGSGELTVFCAALLGACIGFLWYNTHPAEVFMGDTGSLALGGALAAVATLVKSEFLLLLVGAVFVAEMLSVIIQRFVFKYRKRRYGIEYAREHRVFKRAPLHHHFEVKGWDEAQVVVRFWIIGVLAAFIALSTLKLR
jgi:phospho-N-acetylmuramoyl-pentapeptide-transferase